jgi:hypothetical protein
VEQTRILRRQRANHVDIVAADGIRHSAREHEPRPARDAVAPRERVLRVSEARICRIDRAAMMSAKLGHGIRVAALDGSEQIAGLVLQLIEIRPDWKVASRHDEPP